MCPLRAGVFLNRRQQIVHSTGLSSDLLLTSSDSIFNLVEVEDEVELSELARVAAVAVAVGVVAEWDLDFFPLLVFPIGGVELLILSS